MMNTQCRSTDALRRVLPTTMGSYPAFCGWDPQDAWCERMSVTFDLRQCGLETGEVEVMELAGNSNAATSTIFLRQLRGDTSNR